MGDSLRRTTGADVPHQSLTTSLRTPNTKSNQNFHSEAKCLLQAEPSVFVGFRSTGPSSTALKPFPSILRTGLKMRHPITRIGGEFLSEELTTKISHTG